MAHHGTLGHFLPYLLGRRLKAVLWPDAGEGRAALIMVALMVMAYGTGLAFLLNQDAVTSNRIAQKLLVTLNGIFYASALLVDFMPTYRPVHRPLPDHFPVSGKLNLATAFLLDLITVRRFILLLFVLVSLAGAPHAWRPLGLSLLVLLAAATISFNLRLLLSMGRWRHPLFALNLLFPLAAVGWLSTLITLPLVVTVLMVLAVVGPLVLWGVALTILGEKFNACNLAVASESKNENQLLARLSPEWKVYLRKCWPALVMALVFKVLLLAASAVMAQKGQGKSPPSLFYMSFLPVIGFTYVNNNLFGYLYSITANEISRLGLTSRLLRLYLRLSLPILLLDCSISALVLLLAFPHSYWLLIGLLPLASGAILTLGLWGSLYKAKPIYKNIDFANMRNNASTLMNILTLGLAAVLYLMPWWWARIALATLVTLTAWVPIQRIRRNDGSLRRQLWHDLNP